MCGIIGILGEREVAPLLLDGLRRLEYRGYDWPVGHFGKWPYRAAESGGQNRPAGGGSCGSPLARHDRHRPYALGHARRRN